MAITIGEYARAAWLADRVDRVIASVTGSHRLAIALLVLFSLLAFAPGLADIPPIDRDEPRYAQATKQMMETGNYLDIRYQEQPRYLQPVGIYWLQAAAAWITGTAPHAPIWVHRLPSQIGATAAVVLTYWVALPLAGSTGALMAALFLGSSFLLGFEARLAKTDAVLLATCLAALGFLARAYLGRPITLLGAMLFWVSLAAGTLIKGPLIAFVVGCPALVLSVLDRSFAWLKALRPGYGVGLYVLLVLPWLIAISLLSEGGFLRIAVGQSFLARLRMVSRAMARHPGSTSRPTGSPSGRLPALSSSRRRGRAWSGTSGRSVSALPGSSRPGSASNWWSRSFPTTCCRSIRRSPSSSPWRCWPAVAPVQSWQPCSRSGRRST